MLKFYSKVVFGVFLFLLVSFSPCFSQGTTLSGTVKDEKASQPLIGVSILIKGKVLGTITDSKGNFSLSTKEAPPFTLVVSMIGFQTQELEVTSSQTSFDIKLKEQIILGQEVVVSASRVEESILKSPVSIEKMDAIAIRETASDSYYKSIANLKGVDMSSSSINFQIINARGFNSTGNERFVQWIDGMDTQAPALNFPIGNLNGPSELDVENVELIPGAASALYGPNAFNGILLINSKNPFKYQGLSAFGKFGVNHIGESDISAKPMYEAAIRYAKAFNNKFAFKANFSYSRAEDWHGNNQDDVAKNRQPEGFTFNPGADRVHAFGEVANISLPLVGLNLASSTDPNAVALKPYLGDLPNHIVARTPYEEKYLVDYTAQNLKANAALHYRITENIEALYNFNLGYGTSVYTGANRYSLKNFNITQHKLELKGDNFYIRGYTTQERSGDSYIADAVGANINNEWLSNSSWFGTYALNYLGALAGGKGIDENGNVAQSFTPLGPGQINSASDKIARQMSAHQIARGAADAGRWSPDSPEYKTAATKYKGILVPKGGLFDDQTNLYHAEFQYNFKNQIKFMDLLGGASYRHYDLGSNGTIFADSAGNDITIFEYGAYLQGSKMLFDDQLKITGSVRYDKNENFKGQVSPRLSGVYTVAQNHNLRASYQTGFRNPTTQGQHINLDVGSLRILGGLSPYAAAYQIYDNAYTLESVNKYVAAVSAAGSSAAVIDPNNLALLERVVKYDPVKPERVQAWEVGYKGLLDNKILIDVSYYYNTYRDFIVQNQIRKAGGDISVNPINAQALLTNNANTFQVYTNVKKPVTAQGIAASVNYSLPRYYSVGVNYSWNHLNTDLGSGVLNQFNTPQNKVNVSFGNRKVTDNIGFNLTWRWQETFLWEGTFAVGKVPSFQTMDAQVSYRIPNIKSIVKVGGSNIFNQKYIQNYGGPTIGAIYYVSLTFDQLFN